MVIAQWLQQLGLPEFVEAFSDNGINEDILADLTTSDLIELGVSRLGDRKRILKAIALLNPTKAESSAVVQPQRRQLTVMFCDLVGSTSLSTQLDPEDLREIIRSYQATCRPAILGHNGYISHYMGDGIMVYFGYPHADEHSVENAVRAGLQIITDMAQLNQDLEKKHSIELKVRIGIATGGVVVGDIIGEGMSEEAAVVGETPNLAARMQGLAEANHLVIADSTQRLVANYFSCEDLGRRATKGFAAPVQCWRVVGEKDVYWRHQARSGYRSPLVGRDKELGRLQGAWQESCDGMGQVVVVGGEAGIGKSRIALALEEKISEQECFIVRMQCASFRRSTALYPMIESLRLAAGIQSSDGAAVRYQKLKEHTQGQELDGIQAFQLLAPLLSIDVSAEYAPLELPPGRIKALTLETFWMRAVVLAKERPLAIFLEDYHWIDPTSRELLDLVFSRIKEFRILVVITQRTHNFNEWQDYKSVTAFMLNRLNAVGVQQLVVGTLAQAALPSELQKEIVKRTDGVPLFVEEFTRMLQDRFEQRQEGEHLESFLSEQSEIPQTLQDLLLTRLDQLGEARLLAQQAACYGRTFTRNGLRAVAQLPVDQLELQVRSLLGSGLVTEFDDLPGYYQFKHALVQESAYESLLRSSRAAIHRTIALHFERELAESEPEILAYHFGRAGMAERERHFWHQAGRRSMGITSFVEAISYYRKALKSLDRLAGEEVVGHELSLNVELAIPLTLTQGWAAPEVAQAYERSYELSQKEIDSPMWFAALSGTWRYYLVTANFDVAEQMAIRDLARAEQTGDRGLIMEFSLQPGIAHYYRGRMRDSLEHLEHSSNLYDIDLHRGNAAIYGQCTATVALGHQAVAHSILGHPNTALELCQQSWDYAEAAEHPFSLAWSMAHWVIHYILYDNLAACLQAAEKMIRISTEAEFPNWSSQGLVWAGWATACGANPELEKEQALAQGLDLIEQGINIWQMTGTTLMQPIYFTLQAECQLLANNLDAAGNSLSEGLELMEQKGEHWAKPYSLILQIRLALANETISVDEACSQLAHIAREAVEQGQWVWFFKAQQLRDILEERISKADQLPIWKLVENCDDLSQHPYAQTAKNDMEDI